MIVKFLYQMNENNKRIITGVVHNDAILKYNPDYQYDMVPEESYTPKEGETIVYNYGAQFYAVFSDDDSIKYLNFNDYMLKVRVGATDNVAFAATLSKNVLSVILEETAYFNLDFDVNYVDSGLYLAKNKEFKDTFDGWFRKVVDDVYCEINNLRYPLFVGKENGVFILTEDFSKAFRVSKKECRNLLIANEFIDRDIHKKNVCFSHFNIFMCDNGYAFGGMNNFQVTFVDDILKITKNFTMTSNHRLISDTIRAQALKDMCYLMKNPKTDSTAYLKVNGKYVKFLGNEAYELTNEAQLASPIELNQIEILKKAISLFIDNPSFEVVTSKNYFIYEHLDSYELSKEIYEAIPSKLISKDDYEGFIEAFNDHSNEKYIISINDKYVNIELLTNLSFKLSYNMSGFNASRFTLNQIKYLSKVMGVTYNRKEFIPIFNSSDLYNIKPTKAFYTLAEAYEAFTDLVAKSNIRFSSMVDVKELKTESDKGAFEYLKKFYLKTIFDSYEIFKRSLESNSLLTNILLCGTTSTADLIGLSMACNDLDRTVNLVTLEIPKWGVYPSAYISDLVNYEASYRLPITSLDKKMISRFDMIYFGKNFKESPDSLKAYFDDILSLNKNMVIANLSLSGEYGIPNYCYKALSQFGEVSRKYLNYDRTEINILNKNNESIIDKASTYYSLLNIKDGAFIDTLKK